MNRIAKVTALIVCVFLLSGMLAACQPAATSPSGAPAATSAAAPASSAPASAAPQSAAPEDPGSGKLFDEELTIHVMRGEHANQQMRSDAPIFDWIFERTNVKVQMESIPGADWETKAQTLIATDSMPDMMMGIPSGDYPKFAADGMFLNISEYMDKGLMPVFTEFYNKTPEFKSLLVEGSLYCMPNAAYYLNRMGLVPMIRGDLVDKYGLSLPTSFDELYEVLKVFRDNEPDESVSPYVMRGFNIIGNIAFPMGSGNKVYFDGDVEGGKWLYGQATENFKEVLRYVNRLYEEGLLDPDYASTDAQMWQEKMSTGKGLFYIDNPSFSINFDAALKTIDSSFYMIPMNTLKNSLGQQRNYFYSLHWMNRTIINSEVNDPEKIVKFLDWMYTEEGVALTNFGIEGEHYDMVADIPTLKPDIVERHKLDSDPWRGYMGEYGVGLLGFSLYIDERNQWPFMDPRIKTWYDLWIADPGMREPVPAPTLDVDKRATYADIITKCDTIYESEIHNFITGRKDISEWDAVIRQFMDAGLEEALAIQNEAHNANK